MLGISTARPGPRAEALARRPGVSVIDLQELDPTAAREMVMRRFEDPRDAAELADAILARTGGHPLFIEEILASLLHRGVTGGCQSSPPLYCPSSAVTRGQMAVFLVKNFGL